MFDKMLPERAERVLTEIRKPPLTEQAKKEVMDFAASIDESDVMPVILNGAYGGYGISVYAIELYKELYEKMHGTPFDDTGVDWEDVRFRTDALMAAIVDENPMKATLFKPYIFALNKSEIPINIFNPGLSVRGVERKYKGYRSEYKEDKIREIEGNPELDDHEKVAQIGAVLCEPLEELGKELVERYDLI